jgi:hypothetical protein
MVENGVAELAGKLAQEYSRISSKSANAGSEI